MTFTILIVDDVTDNLRLLSDLLKNDYNVLVTKDGNQSINIAQTQQPDLILLDVIMPHICGFHIIKLLKDNPITAHIPVIFTTALGSYDDETKGLSLGAVDYISKPFNPDVVKVRVKNQMEVIRQRHLLEQLANIDALTELPNRRKWKLDTENVHNMFKHYSNLSVGIVDIDHFKQYNDHYGHAQGDKCLALVAEFLNRKLTTLGGYLYRFGGEEFVFLLPSNELDDFTPSLTDLSLYLAQQKLEHITSPTKEVITISGGVCTQKVSNDLSIKRILERADELLYLAKANGRHRILSTDKLIDRRR